MDKNFKLSGPFADVLMQEAETGVKTRGYTPEELADTAIPVEYDPVFDSPSLILEFLRMQSQIDYHSALRSGGWKGFVKRCLLKLFAWFIIPSLNMQNVYNDAVLNVMEEMCNELEVLKKQVAWLNEDRKGNLS